MWNFKSFLQEAYVGKPHRGIFWELSSVRSTEMILLVPQSRLYLLCVCVCVCLMFPTFPPINHCGHHVFTATLLPLPIIATLRSGISFPAFSLQYYLLTFGILHDAFVHGHSIGGVAGKGWATGEVLWMQWKEKMLTDREAASELSPLLTTFVALGKSLDSTVPSIFLFILKKHKETIRKIGKDVRILYYTNVWTEPDIILACFVLKSQRNLVPSQLLQPHPICLPLTLIYWWVFKLGGSHPVSCGHGSEKSRLITPHF